MFCFALTTADASRNQRTILSVCLRSQSCAFEIDWEGEGEREIERERERERKREREEKAREEGKGEVEGTAKGSSHEGKEVVARTSEFGYGQRWATATMVEAARAAMKHVRALSPLAGCVCCLLLSTSTSIYLPIYLLPSWLVAIDQSILVY